MALLIAAFAAYFLAPMIGLFATVPLLRLLENDTVNFLTISSIILLFIIWMIIGGWPELLAVSLNVSLALMITERFLFWFTAAHLYVVFKRWLTKQILPDPPAKK